MLKQRVITALIAAPLVVAALFLLPALPFAIAFAVLTGLGAQEWVRLAGVERAAPQAAYLALFAALLAWLWLEPAVREPMLIACCALWMLAALAVVRYPRSAPLLPRPLLLILGLPMLGGAWLALITVREAREGPWLVIWLFLLVWGADIGAYFAGRRFGRHKLALAVSPGKTWEGAVGGLALAWLACALLLRLPPLDALEWRLSTASVAIVALCAISIIGDLWESVLKRMRGVKDSGRIFPGHGGVLDRIDSLIAALPFFGLFVVERG
jgi:phosphatidate cytidylyltransferase